MGYANGKTEPREWVTAAFVRKAIVEESTNFLFLLSQFTTGGAFIRISAIDGYRIVARFLLLGGA